MSENEPVGISPVRWRFLFFSMFEQRFNSLLFVLLFGFQQQRRDRCHSLLNDRAYAYAYASLNISSNRNTVNGASE